MSDADFELVAASLRADASDLHAFVEALAAKLEGALPERTRVERAGGFLGGRKRVRAVSVRLGEREFRLEGGDGTPACLRRTVVRGIALSSDNLPLEEWIDELSRAVAAEASGSERGREALGRLLGA